MKKWSAQAEQTSERSAMKSSIIGEETYALICASAMRGTCARKAARSACRVWNRPAQGGVKVRSGYGYEFTSCRSAKSRSEEPRQLHFCACRSAKCECNFVSTAPIDYSCMGTIFHGLGERDRNCKPFPCQYAQYKGPV